MQRVGFIGWRGMVGSVLMQRLTDEQVFSTLEPIFFSSSQSGQKAPDYGQAQETLYDAYDIPQLKTMDIIVSTQGSAYTQTVYSKLRQANWTGYWIDAASHLRLEADSLIVLDPINKTQLTEGLQSGIKTYIGGNCTVSLMLLALDGILKEQLIDWLMVSTYQAISGAGAKAIQELFAQYNQLSPLFADLASPHLDSLRLEQNSQHLLKQAHCPTHHIGALLATNVLPWIDEEHKSGQTKEEWKGMSESNKILGYKSPIPIDSTCVRVSTLRSHCQTITMQLKQDLSLSDIETKLKQANPWVQVIPNEKEATLKYLTPVATANSLNIHVGRLRRMHQGPRCVQLFTVGDQLLWGAAEPLKRMLQMIIEFKDNPCAS